ncbi:MAG: hypothetical protein HOK61_02290 [Alphaproteobacteria bacterium]|jgi:hypothetical protein|nr:hypothetical protein [Alphaproteobacteria bacterium]
MTGGPTGFPGAERYQYNDTMSEGRAVAAARKLKADGMAPDELNVLLPDRCHWSLHQTVAARGADTAGNLGA